MCEQKESRMAGARDSGVKWGDRQGYDSSQKPLQVMVRIQFFSLNDKGSVRLWAEKGHLVTHRTRVS